MPRTTTIDLAVVDDDGSALIDRVTVGRLLPRELGSREQDRRRQISMRGSTGSISAMRSVEPAAGFSAQMHVVLAVRLEVTSCRARSG